MNQFMHKMSLSSSTAISQIPIAPAPAPMLNSNAYLSITCLKCRFQNIIGQNKSFTQIRCLSCNYIIGYFKNGIPTSLSMMDMKNKYPFCDIIAIINLV